MNAATIDAPAAQRSVQALVDKPDGGAPTAITADGVASPRPHADEPAAKRPERAPATRPPVDAPAGSAAPEVWQPPRKPVRTIVLVVLLAAGAMLAILKAWDLPPFVGGTVRTDNAYVHGLTMSVAPQVSGYVVAVEIKDFEQVRAGQVLVRVDDRMYKARVSAAKANLSAQIAALANGRAQLMRARADMARVDDLVSDGSVSIRERDQTLAALRQAEAQVRQANGAQGSIEAQVDAARAQLELAQIDLEHTVISATADGQVSEIGVRVGQYVTSGTQLMSLVPADRWVTADFKEGQVANIVPGQRASFTVDALHNAQFTGRVERLAPAAGSEFAVLKPDNATGNFVKVPQRIGVRIAIDPGQRLASRLAPGMSVEAVVETKAGRR